MNLTPPMRAALQAAKRDDGLRRVHNPTLPGKPPWPAAANTLHALTRHQLLHHARINNRRGYPTDTWTLTPTGRRALEIQERFIEQPDLYLADRRLAGGDYTRNRHRAIDDLPAVIDDLHRSWRRRAEHRHAASQDPKKIARQLARNARAA